jgi:hypothetical protein
MLQPLNLTKTLYKVSDFVSWQRSKSLRLSPSFQRRPVWRPPAKSYLLDTILRGLPIPIVFLRERLDVKALEPYREVVDGQQRLRTVLGFVDPKLLPDFVADTDGFTIQKNHYKEFAGKKFRELPLQAQQQILNYEFSVHVFPSQTDDKEVLQVFSRMNATGVKANPQELRNAEFFGNFKDLAYELSYQQLARWRGWGLFSENDIARMSEVEFTSELLLLIMEGLAGKSQAHIDNAYRASDADFPAGEVVATRFQVVMDTIDDLIGPALVKTCFSGVGMFYALFAFIYDLLYGLGSKLKKARPTPLRATIKKGLLRASEKYMKQEFDPELAKAIRGGAGDLSSREVRFKFVRDA